jgi:hypothetical protein
MCIIIAQEIGAKELTDDNLLDAWIDNPDGAGYAFVARDGIVLRKPFFDFDEFVAAYRGEFERHNTTSPFLLHFRIATSGKHDELNTHPHFVNPDLVVAHNGIFSFLPGNGTESDTVHFIKFVLSHRTTPDILSAPFVEHLEHHIGVNKLAFLSENEGLTIVNEGMGRWDKGNWYSTKIPSGTRVYQSWNDSNTCDVCYGIKTGTLNPDYAEYVCTCDPEENEIVSCRGDRYGMTDKEFQDWQEHLGTITSKKGWNK